MEKTDWFIEDWNSKKMLFTYSEEEKQEQEVKNAHSKLIYSPHHITIYMDLINKWYSLIDCYVFWFIHFYLWEWKWKRFYFCDKDFSEILKISESSVSNSLKRLSEDWFIIKRQKMKAGWWTIRFVELLNSNNCDYQTPLNKISKQDDIRLHIKDNKIKDNKINSNQSVAKPDRKTISITPYTKEHIYSIIDIETLSKEFAKKNVKVEFERFWNYWEWSWKKIKKPTLAFRNWLLPKKREKEYMEWVKDKTDIDWIKEYKEIGSKKFRELYGDEKRTEVKEKLILQAFNSNY